MSVQNNTEPPTKEIGDLKLENGGHVNSGTPPPKTPPPSAGCIGFSESFKNFAKFGDPKSDGKHITLSNSDKWMKQAKVIDGKKITTTDTGIYFKKLKSQKVGIEDYKKFLEDLAKNKKIDVEEIKNKLANCGQPGTHLSGVSSIVFITHRFF